MSVAKTSKPSIASVVLGTIGIGFAWPTYRWTRFIASINLGENDFAGLFYMGVHLLLLGATVAAGILAVVFGVMGASRDRSRRTSITGVALGVGSLLIAATLFAISVALAGL